MKRIAYILTAAFLFTLTWSCSEDIMDEINVIASNSTGVDSKLIITDAMTATAFTVVGSDLAFYASTYMEHNVGVWSQSYNAEIRSGEPTSSTTYNNSWSAIYRNLYNLNIIIEKCSEGGPEEGNDHTLGIAQALSAYNLAVLTDVMGDVPWTEALQPGIIYTPVLDAQQDIYTVIMGFVDDAIANLQKESEYPSLGKQDFIYGGDEELWLKFAYGLKARYLMRLSHKSPNYQGVIDAADLSFASAADQALYNYNGSTATSPFYSFFKDRNYFGASQSLHDRLLSRNDPRDSVFFKPHPNSDDQATIIFAPNGTPNQILDYYSVSALSTPTAPTYLLSYHEIEFLKAEAYARLEEYEEAETALQNAITAAFGKVNIGLSAAKAEAYYTDDVEARFDADPLAEIMIQKYIAFFEEEAVEAYNDYRRLEAMGDDVIVLANPLNATKFPLRFTYGADDVTTNPNVASAYGDGTYVYTENVWWAGGTR
ncbi:MAG: SusD/RagB family nutrient-binding outer membrane lipoprotein [Bacteroidales bacterium]|nr:SusD/RagB family nutrient-binding outer membrane lipoprotein [Bacteroidales bacterium]